MSHSLAFFTAHERTLLRHNWGSQATRLTRDSFLPFGYCRLCLAWARTPVVCGDGVDTDTDTGRGTGTGTGHKVHLFCRECALNDLMAQRKEAKRLEREGEARERDREDSKRRDDDEKRRRDLEGFERAEMGFDDETPDARAGKRKRATVAEEMHSQHRSTGNEGQAKKAKTKTQTPESSFWIPGAEQQQQQQREQPSKPQKSRPLCPGSTPEDKHAYSLKSLVAVVFAEGDERGSSKTDGQTRICPSCKKVLTNTSRPMLGTAEGCGHVVCGACADLFLGANASNGHAGRRADSTKSTAAEQDKDTARVACYVCEADLGGGRTGIEANGVKESRKDKRHGKPGRLVEVSCEGTGFAGGGSNVAKREGVAFQC